MSLYSTIYGKGQPMVIVHGLFGMSDNWTTIAKQFADYFEVHILDLPNHGRSPHTNEFNYNSLSQAVKQYFIEHSLEHSLLIGHSLGGKTAMQLATSEPELISKLIVVDISPRFYPIHHDKILKGLNAVDLLKISSRLEAEKRLAEHISELDVRQFLLKSMYWKEKGKLDFRFNLPVITKNIANVGEELGHNNCFIKPTLFLKGELSNYISEDDEDLIFHHFPKAEIEVISGSGHWLHAENPSQFVDEVMRFSL
ncbi:MAG: alpha/beta fold hydrolase [Flavobacteriales bacterium]